MMESFTFVFSVQIQISMRVYSYDDDHLTATTNRSVIVFILFDPGILGRRCVRTLRLIYYWSAFLCIPNKYKCVQ